MTHNELYQRFSQGLSWNALLYLMYKCATTTVTLLLYTRLDHAHFSLYGNLNSIIYLLLLWLDFGLQKTIPRFGPFYAHNSIMLKRFIYKIIIFKIVVLLVAIPLYTISACTMMNILTIKTYQPIIAVGCLLFITEGITSIVRLTYHAYFLHAVFNRLNIYTLGIELIISLGVIYTIQDHALLLVALLCAKIIAQTFLLLLAWRSPIILQHQKQPSALQNFPAQNIDRQCIIHATAMSMSNGIKSMSERNFLFPVFTVLFGVQMANTFKIAHEGALFFYRIAIKTIGTTDTSLLSYSIASSTHTETMQNAFEQLCIKIATLIIPLSAIIYCVYLYQICINYNPSVFRLFLIIITFLLSETLFSPYERILEVQRNYGLLTVAYAPYMIIMTLLFSTHLMTSIGMFYTLLIIHIVRLVSMLLMTGITHMRYHIHYPIRSIFIIICTIYIPLNIVLYFLNIIINNYSLYFIN